MFSLKQFLKYQINISTYQEKTNVRTDKEYPKFKVNTFINLDMDQLAADIMEIVDIAQVKTFLDFVFWSSGLFKYHYCVNLLLHILDLMYESIITFKLDFPIRKVIHLKISRYTLHWLFKYFIVL